MRNSQKGFIIPLLITIIIILLVGGGYYIYSNTKVQTKAPVEWNNKEISLYHDTKYNFEISLPKGFYDAGAIDGIYAYNKYFTSIDIKGDFNKLIGAGKQLSVSVSKDEKITGNDGLLKEVKSIAKISNSKTVTIDNQAAIEQFEDYSNTKNGDTGCSLSTYFKENGVSNTIVLWSADCNTISNSQSEYDVLLNSFHYLR